MGTKTYTCIEVAQLHGLKEISRKGTNIYYQCPFCGTTEKKFAVGETGYICFRSSCGASGGPLTLHEKLSGKSFASPKEIAKDLHQAFENTDYDFKTFQKDFAKSVKKEASFVRSDEDHNNVYKALLSMLTLNKNHEKDLVRRGLKKIFDFKSVPTQKEERLRICRKLMSNGYSLKGIRGFYMNDEGDWEFAAYYDGYFCPVYNDKMQIIAFQIRVDKPVNGNKYIWFSSAGKTNGTPSGAPSTYYKGKRNAWIITEGVLKARVIFVLLGGQIGVVGVPGVKCLKGLSRYHLDRNIWFSYDMDQYEDSEKGRGIRKDALKLKQKAEELWSSSNRKDLKWNMEYKGLDDYLITLAEDKRKEIIDRLCEV